MANQKQLEILNEGVAVWNKWREKHPRASIDLSGISLVTPDLSHANLAYADLSQSALLGANLDKANLTGAVLIQADFEGASLNEADLNGAELDGAYFINAMLNGAKLTKANLSRAFFTYAGLAKANLSKAVFVGTDLSYADLGGANLQGAKLASAFCFQTNLRSANLKGANLQNLVLNETNLESSVLTGCRIYGLSAWGLKGIPKEQSNLIITPDRHHKVTVDDLQVAQFIYLLLNNQNVRNVIDTITSKAVLILGRFTDERKAVLDAIHEELRKRNYLPILFDFTGSKNRDITETISTLAHLARFVVADLTDAKSIPQELQAIIPDLPSLPIQPVLHVSQKEYSMFEHYERYPWVLKTFYYKDSTHLISSIPEKVIKPSEAKFEKQNKGKAK